MEIPSRPLGVYLIEFERECVEITDRFVAASALLAIKYAMREYGEDIQVTRVQFVEAVDDYGE